MTELSRTSLDKDYEPYLSSLFLYTIPIFEDSQNSLMKIQDNGNANISVGPQALPTLLKAIAVRKDAYPNLIVHSPKRPWRTQGEFMDTTNLPIYQQSPIPLVGPQTLLTLLKAIAVRKDTYPNLIVHSPKCPRRTQEELMDAANPSICQQ